MSGAHPMLTISTLGRFEVRRGQELLVGGNWRRRKVCDLFKLLLSANQHCLHREQVQELLWPFVTTTQSANSFGKTLYLLRRALEPELEAGKGGDSYYIRLDRDILQLSTEYVAIDADDFEVEARKLQMKLRNLNTRTILPQAAHTLLDEFERVLTLYTGDYLLEDLYEDWAQHRRDVLCRLYCSLLEQGAEFSTMLGKGQQACEYLQKLLEKNPMDEQTYRQLMLIYARMGRRGDVRQLYERLQEIIKDELHATPLPETLALFHRIQAGQVTIDLGGSSGLTSALSTMPISLDSTGLLDAQEQDISSTPAPELPPSYESTISEKPAAFEQERAYVESGSSLPYLIGREKELKQLGQIYRQALTGQPGVVCISGEGGIGKTHLVSEFISRYEVREQGTVLWGDCYEAEETFCYQPLAVALATQIVSAGRESLTAILEAARAGRAGIAELAEIVPELRIKFPELARTLMPGVTLEKRTLYATIEYYLETLAQAGPLVVVLDNLQWADTETLQLLCFLINNRAKSRQLARNERAVHPAPLYILLYRSEEIQGCRPLLALIESVFHSGSGEDLSLQRLSLEQVQTLLAGLVGQPVPPDFAREIYRCTGGNPLFVHEIVCSLLAEGRLQWHGEYWQAALVQGMLAIPQNVRLLLERRLRRLSPACHATMMIAALLGSQFSSDQLCQICDLPEEVLARQLDEAIGAQVLYALAAPEDALKKPAQADVDLAFTHELLREALYQALNPLRRRLLYRQIARAFLLDTV